MLGFSLPKLLVLALIIAVVWYGFKWIGKVDRDRKAAVKARRDEPVSRDAEDMVKCEVCGTFVPVRGASGCGRADCPYGG